MRPIDADALMTEFMDSDLDHLQRDDWREVIQIVADAPTITLEPHWIPVTQALPEDDTIVLVCGKGGGIYTAIHNNSKTWIRGWWKMNSKNHQCNPIAWMPLPEPFKGVTT